MKRDAAIKILEAKRKNRIDGLPREKEPVPAAGQRAFDSGPGSGVYLLKER
jgi:hypothetical protein